MGWVLFCIATATLAQTVLEVIPLRYRTAEQVIPIIQPMLAREGSVSGFQGQLVVRTTPANLEEIKRILASLDNAPRQLLITVRQDADTDRSRSAAELSGSVGGEHGRVTIPGGRDPRGGNVVLREGDDRVRVQVIEGRSSESDRNTQSVRVMEGREAYVRVGQSVPVRERQVRRPLLAGRWRSKWWTAPSTAMSPPAFTSCHGSRAIASRSISVRSANLFLPRFPAA